MLIKIFGTIYLILVMTYILKIFFEALRNWDDWKYSYFIFFKHDTFNIEFLRYVMRYRGERRRWEEIRTY